MRFIEFSKTNAEGRKRYKRKLRPKTKQSSGLLNTKEDRDKVKTSIQVVQEGRKWLNTGINLKRVFR